MDDDFRWKYCCTGRVKSIPSRAKLPNEDVFVSVAIAFGGLAQTIKESGNVRFPIRLIDWHSYGLEEAPEAMILLDHS